MTRSLSSKAKVVHSLFFVVAVLAPTLASAQNFLQKKVVVNVRDTYFADALQLIEEQTNIHFIYSSNVVDPGRKINIPKGKLSVNDLLAHLGKELHLEFKTLNEYVIIKKAAVIPAPPPLTLTVQKTESTHEEQATLEEPGQITRARSYAESSNPQSIDLSEQIHRRYLFKLDSATLRNTLLTVKPSIRPRASRTFLSAGLFMNDFSGGVELQAGIKRLYGVFNTSFAEGGYVRMGYGLGSNISLGSRFSVSPIYTFASLKQLSDDGITTISENGYYVRAEHHQLKLMVQYKFARNFTAKLGPSFNFMNLTFTEQPQEFISNAGRVQGRSYPGQQPDHQGTFFFSGNNGRTPVFSPNTSYHATKSWVGFEAGIYYSINFSKVR